MERTECSEVRGRDLVRLLIIFSIAVIAVASISMDASAGTDDASELQDLLDDESSSRLELTRDYVIDSAVTISRSLIVDGNGHSITYTASDSAISIESGDEVVLEDLVVNATSSGGRGVYVFGTVAEVTLKGCTINAYLRGIDYDMDYGDGGSLTIDGTDILNSRITDYDRDVITDDDSRGIAVWGGSDCTIQILNGSTVKGFKYSINASNYGDDNGVRPGGNTYVIRDSAIVGWCAFNIFSVQNTFEITNSILRGLSDLDGDDNNFAVISIDGTYGGKTQNANVFNIRGGTLEARATGTAVEAIILDSPEVLTEFNFHMYDGEPVVIDCDGSEMFTLRGSVTAELNVTGIENVRSSSHTIDEDTGQEITTSVETAEGGTRTSISTSTADDAIRTEAVISDGTATVAVTAASGTSLADAVSQASLISGIVTRDSGLPGEISRTEITVETEGGPSVTLPIDVAESLVGNTGAGSGIRIVVGDQPGQTMTDAQVSALGDGKAYEISALLVEDSDGKVIGTVHDLGGTVMAFLPYAEGSGDPEGLGVYYIDTDGEKIDMEAVYDPARRGYVFSTDHFSLFAVMEIPVAEPRLIILPPFPDDDSAVIQSPVADGGDSGDTIKTTACVAVAVVAAMMVVYLAADLRRSR